MRKVFKDEALQREFDEKGYVKIKFLEPDQVQALIDKFFELEPMSKGNVENSEADFDIEGEITYDFTFINRNKDYKRTVMKEINKVFLPVADKFMDDYRPIIANYIRKRKDTGEVPLHQNWAFVDEEKYTSISIWCPLVDSEVDNGTLQFVDGSHKRFGKLRGPLIPWECEDMKETIISDYLTTFPTRAGEAVILDDSVIHYSNVNKTEGLRLAIQLIMVPSESPTIHYHMDLNANDGVIHEIEVDDDFFMEFHPWLKPGDYKERAKYQFEARSHNRPSFDEVLRGPKFDEPGFKEWEARVSAQKQEKTEADAENGEGQEEWVWVDDRSFWQKYTPANILTEIKQRISKS